MNRKGFTIWEMLVASAIVVILSTVVLANFRTARTSSERETVLQILLDGVRTVRTMSLGGQIQVNGTFPTGGYGIRFDTVLPSQFDLFALNGVTPEVLPNGTHQFSKVQIVALCGSDAAVPSEQPCGTDWQSAGGVLEIVFTSAGTATVITPTGQTYKHAGGLLRHPVTGQQAYFYITLQSGLGSGGLL